MDIKKWKNEWHSVPNLLSLFRLVLLPLYLYFVITANKPSDFYWAGVVIAISGISDFLDGYIARKYNQITDLGKVLDPVADKITQLALLISMAYYYSEIWLLIPIFISKEGFMAIAGAIGLKKGIKLNGAKWYGKIATAFIYIGMVILLLFPGLDFWFRRVIYFLILFFLMQSFLLYIFEYYRLFQSKKQEGK